MSASRKASFSASSTGLPACLSGPAQHGPLTPGTPCELELTFRDPAGQLLLLPGEALRRIRPAAAEHARAFLDSPLRSALEQSGDLIPTVVAEPHTIPQAGPDELWLRHPRIDPISYPWEWTPAQWQAAADLTLHVAAQALDAGWALKDATPLNILFAGARPVFVDVLSFERRDSHSSVWLAYGQFVRTFLLPLVARKYLSWPLEATMFWRDGYEPTTIYRALPRLKRLSPALFDVVTLAALFEGKGGGTRKPPSTHPELAAHILHKRLARLKKQIQSAVGTGNTSEWSRYTQTASHYQPSDTENKQRFVRSVLERCRPGRVLDIGANTGTYSLMASEAGAEVVALDNDTAAIEQLWRSAAGQHRHITALVANVARPTPAAGWKNREHHSLLDRLAGKFDLVLMLAVIHHLILREQLPLAHIAELCSGLANRWLVLEWVPPTDPMYREWLRGRDALYGHLSEDDLLRAFAPYFRAMDRKQLGNERVLLLFERNDASSEAGTA